MTQAVARRRNKGQSAVRLLANGFPVLETKLAAPPPRKGLLKRSVLIDRLAATKGVPIIAVLAPAGYGKSTLIAQWAETDSRDFAWLSIDVRDNDPSLLLAYIAYALGGASSLGPDIDQSLGAPGQSIWTSVVPRLGAALAARRRAFVLVLDNVETLTERDSADAIVALASHLDGESQFVLAGRSPGQLPIPRIIAGDRGVLIQATDLMLDLSEIAAVMRAANVELSSEDLESIADSTEGWPAGVYLTALAIHSRPPAETGRIRASPIRDAIMAGYIRTELLGRLSSDALGFMLDASALERLSGPLCDMVMKRSDSGVRLEEMARSNLLLIPLDDRHEWYRYHHLLREHLLAELRARNEPRLMALYSRAAAWHESAGDPETALDYAMLAEQTDVVARLLPELAQRAYNSGRVGSLRRWFKAVDQAGLPRDDIDLAVLGAIIFGLLDDPGQAERWARYVLDQPLDGADAHGTAMLRFGRAYLCRSGVATMLTDAEAALALFPEDSQFLAEALLLKGVAQLASGSADGADESFIAAIDAAAVSGIAQSGAAAAHSHRAVIAMARGDWDAADGYVREARKEVHAARNGEEVAAALVDAASARVALRLGDHDTARANLAHAQRLRPILTPAIPWTALRARLDLAHACVALADAPGARVLLAEIRDILVQRPKMGAMVDEASEIQRQVRALRGESVGASTLTTAELRLLPFLTTYLSFKEIGTQLFVSHNTVKTQAISIYRKLGATSRSEAIERAVELGLLESTGGAHRFIPSG
jgi:LuxR family maltose regulon positive regulatory protein